MKNLGLLSGILGLTGVALGAFGAHALKDFLLAHGTLDAWETGVRYHLVHAVALLALAASREAKTVQFAGKCFALGVLLFSGSLYGYALSGPHFLVFLTPIGGLFLLAGWGAIFTYYVKLPAGPGQEN